MEESASIDSGSAGASGHREHERRLARREAKTLEDHPRIGKLLLKLQGSPQHEKAWATGSSGEEMLAASLLKRCPDVTILHDRRIPGSRANIDHLAIAPSGVYVIDAKRYKGKVEARKPIFGPEKLMIAGRDKTKLIETLKWQAGTVQAAINSLGEEAPLHACLCFLNPKGQAGGTDIPALRTLRIKGYPLYVPRKLAKQLNQPGELRPDRIRTLTEALAERFPSA